MEILINEQKKEMNTDVYLMDGERIIEYKISYTEPVDDLIINLSMRYSLSKETIVKKGNNELTLDQYIRRSWEKEILLKLLKEIKKDELEYCFNRAYCDDETWKNSYGNETREDAYNKAINDFSNMSVDEIMECFGDKYQYVLDLHQKV